MNTDFTEVPLRHAMDITYDSFLKSAGELAELDWRKFRRRSARRHLEERLQELGLPDYGQYLEHLRVDTEEVLRLPDLMRVTVSRFFRERACWLELSEKVLPALLESREADEPIRAWSVGCCNGEEPYSLAILFLSNLYSSAKLRNRKVEILATDIDDKVLARARDGCYQKSSLREAPGEVVEHFFSLDRRGRCLHEDVKALIRFKKHNFMEDQLPLGMDLVLCRYLAFTYYRGERRRQAALRLWEAVKPGGALMTGRKESLGPGEAGLFEPWPETEVIYRKKTS